MRWTRVLTCGLIVLLVVAAAAPARAGEILFSIRDGRVTLVARNAQLSDILAVWEREGRTKIVARERVQGTVVSLELTNEPESTALATVLRSVTGYIAVKRPVPPGNASIYRCVIINPVPAPLLVLAQAPAAGPTQPPRGFPMGAPQSMVGDSGMFPQAFIPPPDDSDDPGTARLQMPIGARLPGTATPSMPSRTISPGPHASTATAGLPAAMASATARPNGSRSAGCTSTSSAS